MLYTSVPPARRFRLRVIFALSLALPASLALAAAPVIGSVSPNSNLPVAGGTSITVNGSSFVQSGPKSFNQISGGVNHTCGIAADDHLAYCWGFNDGGQLGDATNTTRLLPVAVNTSGALAGLTLQQISAGYFHTCAIASNGKAYCWGYNGYGALGNNSSASSSTPVAVDTSGALAGLTISQISAGLDHTCVIASNGRAYCWGWNYDGQLGNNSSTGPDTCTIGTDTFACAKAPVAVNTSGVLAGLTLQQISAGFYHTCALATTGRAYCWGDNIVGQLGNNTSTGPSTCGPAADVCSKVPVAVDTTGALVGIILQRIAAGRDNSCAVATNGRAYCWGWNKIGQLGIGSNTGPSTCDANGACAKVPVAVTTTGALAGLTLHDILLGGFHACALATNGRAYCWGDNESGQLGNNSSTGPSSCTVVTTVPCAPAPVAINTAGALAGLSLQHIWAGAYHTCATTANGRAYCWGLNSGGELGNNSNTGPDTCSAQPCAMNPTAVIVPTVNSTLPTVKVGGMAATDVVVASDLKLTFTAPPMPPGTYDLVIDYGSTSVSQAKALTYSAATLTSQDITGAWYDSALTGSGFNVTQTSVGLLVYYYGWDKDGHRLWLSSDIGPTSIMPGDAITLDMYETHIGNFNSPAKPGTGTIWGSLQLDFSSGTRGNAILTGNDGALNFNMTKLIGMSNTASATGAWYDSVYAGSGFNLLMTDSGLLLYYYGWDKDGQRLWLTADFGPKSIVAGTPIKFDMVETNGGTFTAPAKPGTATPWGTLDLNFSSDSSGKCNKATATLNGKDGAVTFDMGMLVGVLDMPPGC